MAEQSNKIAETCPELERFSEPAFEFLRQGLDYTVQSIHGAMDPTLARLMRLFQEQGIEPGELSSLIENDQLPDQVVQIVEQMGGALDVMNRMNRHVSGRDLCNGLRDYALSRWGLLAPSVLRCWGVRETKDFGRMVFALVEKGVLQKQPEDRIEDFDGVYSFDRAFDDAYKIKLGENKLTDERKGEE